MLLALNNPIVCSTNSNTMENILFVASENHFSSSAAQSYLFQGSQGQILIATSLDRTATEANLMMGVDSGRTFCRISSVRSNGSSGFLPIQYNANVHSFVGNVGIGTGSPIVPFHIQGSNRLALLAHTTTSPNFVEFNSNAASGLMYVGMDSSAGNGLFGSGDAYGVCLGAASNTSVNLATNNLIRLKIGADGNVTIGAFTYAQRQANLTVYQAGNASMAIVAGAETNSSTLFLGHP